MEAAVPAHQEVTITPHATAWYRLSRWAFRALGWVLFRITVTGRANVPHGNYIVVANHLSWIDPFLLMMYLPAEPRLYFIGAQQAVNQGWKGWMVDHFDMLIPVRRGAVFVGREVLEKPKRVLSAGAVLGLFPEGCLGPTEGTILPLERGIGHILLAADHPVLPVAISGAQELYLRKPVTVRIGEPLRVAVGGMGHHQAIDAAVEQVTGALRSLLPPYTEPRPTVKRMLFLSNLLDIGLPKKPGERRRLMLVSVAVPAYNEEKYIGACLDALIRQEHPGFDMEIIVVDNNSTDRTGAFARSAGARVVVQRTQGIAWARQAGFEAAGGEIVASTDADSTPFPNWLGLLVAALVKDSQLLGVYGPLRVLDGARWEDLAQCYLIGAVMWLGAAIKRPSFCGPNFAVRRAAWARVGGFDTAWASAEDVNLSLKLARLGKVAFRWDIQVPTSARRRAQGIGALMGHSIANYLRVVWLRQPPLPAENFR